LISSKSFLVEPFARLTTSPARAAYAPPRPTARVLANFFTVGFLAGALASGFAAAFFFASTACGV